MRVKVGLKISLYKLLKMYTENIVTRLLCNNLLQVFLSCSNQTNFNSSSKWAKRKYAWNSSPSKAKKESSSITSSSLTKAKRNLRWTSSSSIKAKKNPPWKTSSSLTKAKKKPPWISSSFKSALFLSYVF